MNPDYNGIWQFDREEETNINRSGTISSVYTFIYDKDSMVIYMPSESSVPGLPDDNVYRIKVKWNDNQLYIFPPLGNKWVLFAVWDANRFVTYGGNKVRIYKKINPEEIAKWQEALLESGRQMWSYPYLNPDAIKIAAGS